jgi:hypothetical protein
MRRIFAILQARFMPIKARILFLGQNPKKSAKILSDRVLILQIDVILFWLSQAMHRITQESKKYEYLNSQIPHEAIKVNDDHAKWLSYSQNNFIYGVVYSQILCKEYTRRFKRNYKGEGLADFFNVAYSKFNKSFSGDTFTAPFNTGKYRNVKTQQMFDEVIAQSKKEYRAILTPLDIFTKTKAWKKLDSTEKIED